MRAFLITLGILLISVLSFLWVGPYFVDWSDYRASFSKALGDFTQRRIQVSGNMVVRVLPVPAVEVSNVKVFGKADSSDSLQQSQEDSFISFKTLTMTLDLGSFLKGELRATSVDLYKPIIRLVKDADGKENWHTDLNPNSDLAFFDELVIEDMTITDGEIIIIDKTIASTPNSDIDDTTNVTIHSASIKADSVYGPFISKGSVSIPDTQFTNIDFNLTLGKIEDASPTEVSLLANMKEAGLTSVLSGFLNLEDSKSELTGDLLIKTRAESTDLLIGVSSPSNWAGHKIDFKSKIKFSSNVRSLSDSELFTPWGTIRGEIEYNNLENKIKADLNTLRLSNAVVENISNNSDDSTASDKPQKSSEPTQVFLLAYQSILQLFESGVEGEINLAANTLGSGEGRINNLKILSKLYQDRWEITNLTTNLPGNSQLEFTGTYSIDENKAGNWIGKISGASQTSDNFLSWFGYNFNELATTVGFSKIGELSFKGNFELSDDFLSIDQFEIAQGNQAISGQSSIQFGDEPNANFSINASKLNWSFNNNNDNPIELKTANAVSNNTLIVPPRLRKLLITNDDESTKAVTPTQLHERNGGGSSIMNIIASVSDTYRILRNTLGNFPIRVNLESGNVQMGKINFNSFKLLSNVENELIKIDSLALRGRGGLALQVSGEISLEENNPKYFLQSSAAGNNALSAADLMGLFDASEKLIADVEQYPDKGIAPFSVLFTWQGSNTSDIRLNASGNIGGAEITYSKVANNTGSKLTESEQVISLSHINLKQLLSDWEINPPESLADNQKIEIRLTLPSKLQDKGNMFAQVRTGETNANLNAEVTWSDGNIIIPSEIKGEFVARGDDPRWWINVSAPGIGSYLSGEAGNINLPYRFACTIEFSERLLKGNDCVGRVLSSKISGDFNYRAEDSNLNRNSSNLNFNATIDNIDLNNIFFKKVQALPLTYDALLTANKIDYSPDDDFDASGGNQQTNINASEFQASSGMTWREDNWQGSLPLDLTTNGKIRIKKVNLTPEVELDNFVGEINLVNGELKLKNFLADWKNGNILLDSKINIIAGSMLMEGNFAISNNVSQDFQGISLEGDEVSLSTLINAKGSISARGSSLKEMAANLSASGAISQENVRVNGIQPDIIENLYYASIRSSDTENFSGEKVFSTNSLDIGNIVGNWSASDGKFRFSAPSTQKNLDKFTAEIDLAELKRKILLKFSVEKNNLPSLDLVLQDVGVSLSNNNIPMLSFVDISELRQQLLVKITENNVFELEQLAVETSEGENELEQIKKPEAIGKVSVETFDQEFEEVAP